MPDPRAKLEAWIEVLAQLESDLEDVEGQSAQRAGWSAPIGLGPLPPELAGRATRLLAAQRASIQSLRDAQQDVGRHLTALRSVPSIQREDHAVYLDVAG